MKKCSMCKIEKPLECFAFKNKAQGRLQSKCRDCTHLQNAKDYAKNKEKRMQDNKEWNKNNKPRVFHSSRKSRLKRKIRCLRYYSDGDIKCACLGCGERRIQFMSIDHIGGGGNEHRRKINTNGSLSGGNIFRWLVKNNFPPGFRVLCFNCNMALGIWGYCPHERENHQVLIPSAPGLVGNP